MVPGLDVEALGEERAPSDFVGDEGAGWVFRVESADEPVRKAPDSCSDALPSASPSLPTSRSASSSPSSESYKAYDTERTGRTTKDRRACWDELEQGRAIKRVDWEWVLLGRCHGWLISERAGEPLRKRGSCYVNRPKETVLLGGGLWESRSKVALKKQRMRNGYPREGQRERTKRSSHLGGFGRVEQPTELAAVVIIKVQPWTRHLGRVSSAAVEAGTGRLSLERVFGLGIEIGFGRSQHTFGGGATSARWHAAVERVKTPGGESKTAGRRKLKTSDEVGK
ncbi:hypothetical protein B0H14DRAFT_2659218 [Mycena olivaceomarginata]|nr:hypothetical protein B0H14DRAFT_2659218 [Mycena olivaceomarginata]